MKNTGKITGMLLMLLVSCNLSLSAQRGMRVMRPDTAEMSRMKMEQRQMHNMNQFMVPMCCPMAWNMTCNMRRPSMNMKHMGPGMRGMSPGMGRNSMGKRHPEMGNRQAVPGLRIIENIPNLTEKQKKDIADLRMKQKDEMQKLKGEIQKKMDELRESHKTKVMNILTDEQKKWLDENAPKPLNN